MFRKAGTLRKKIRQIVVQGNQPEIQALITEIYEACCDEFREDNRASIDSFLQEMVVEASAKHDADVRARYPKLFVG